MGEVGNLRLLGVYELPQIEHVHAFEFEVYTHDFDIAHFTQALSDQDRFNWQVPWDERFLNTDGTKVIGDTCSEADELLLRVVFFFHYSHAKKIPLQRYTVLPY